MKHPPRWQDCKPFVKALRDREYIGPDGTLLMHSGHYLYLYELWQNGVEHGSASKAKPKRKKR